MAQTLPTPRKLLTSLFSSLPKGEDLSQIITEDGTTKQNQNQRQQPTTSNPLRQIPPAYRPLLTTLHVLYPSTLLPALDLLDRRLVTRVLLEGPSSSPSDHHPDLPAAASAPSPFQSISDSDVNLPPPQPPARPLLYHLVRSAAGGSQANAGGGKVYVVRTRAWDCSCAAFAFAAFPPVSSSSSSLSTSTSPAFAFASNASPPSAHPYHIAPTSVTIPKRTLLSKSDFTRDAMMRDEDEDEEAWEFGGLSLDGKQQHDGGASCGGRGESGGVPCCKHLLACVLAERWGSLLGAYVEERIVSREEGAGLVGDL